MATYWTLYNSCPQLVRKDLEDPTHPSNDVHTRTSTHKGPASDDVKLSAMTGSLYSGFLSCARACDGAKSKYGIIPAMHATNWYVASCAAGLRVAASCEISMHPCVTDAERDGNAPHAYSRPKAVEVGQHGSDELQTVVRICVLDEMSSGVELSGTGAPNLQAQTRVRKPCGDRTNFPVRRMNITHRFVPHHEIV